MKYKSIIMISLILCSCGRAPSGSRNPRTEIVMDFFTGYHSGQYTSADGEIYGVSTGGPTELWIDRFVGDFCLSLRGPPRKGKKPGVEFISGQRCGGGKFGYDDWRVYFDKNDRTRLYIVPLAYQGNPHRGIITLTYNNPKR